MKSVKLIVNIVLMGLFILMSCGNKKGHNTEQDPSNDQYEAPIDSTDREGPPNRQRPTSELVPSDKVKSPLEYYKIETFNTEWFEEFRYMASK